MNTVLTVNPAYAALAELEGEVAIARERADKLGKAYKSDKSPARGVNHPELGSAMRDLRGLERGLDDRRQAAAEVIVGLAGELTGIERAVYLHTLTGDPQQRDEQSDRLIEELEHLDGELKVGTVVFEWNKDSEGAAMQLHKVTNPGLQIGFAKERDTFVGTIGIQAETVSIWHPNGIAQTLTIEKPGLRKLGKTNQKKLALPALESAESLITASTKPFAEALAPASRGQVFALYLAGRILGVNLDIENPLTTDERRRLVDDVVAGVYSQAQALTLADATDVTVNLMKLDGEIADLTHQPSEILRTMADIVNCGAGDIKSCIVRGIEGERAAITSGMVTGEDWSRLDIAGHRHKAIIDGMFPNGNGMKALTVG